MAAMGAAAMASIFAFAVLTDDHPIQRAGGQAGQSVRQASEQMQKAAKALGEGKPADAQVAGANAGAGLQSAIVTLQRALEGRAARTDASSEEAPARYEAPISDYFKRLTRAQ
jgi:hypothetical protein